MPSPHHPLPRPARPRAALLVAALHLGLPGVADAALWEDATMATIGASAGWSSKVELADINGDGRVDILFANGRGYASSEGAEVNAAYLNQGPGMPFIAVGDAIFGAADSSRVIKAGDVDGDGDLDLFVGNTWGTQSRLYLGDGGGAFEEVTATHLPAIAASVGDAELGDVDGDGDLDLVLAEWGPGNPSTNGGGVPRLWLNDGGGVFAPAPAGRIPEIAVGWSWELELVDVDNDYDLDLAVSCKSCRGSLLLDNDGSGSFTDASAGLPQFANNYEFEALDLSGDGFVDLVTINDKSPGTREHVLIGDGAGGFVDETAARWPDAENPAGDDNMVAFLDVESDGDADFIIAGLFGQIDRLIINDGAGDLSLVDDAFAPALSPGTLGIAVADLNGDHRLDVVMAEGEAADPDFVFLGVDVPVDSAPPVIDLVEAIGTSDGAALTIRARVHDNKTPLARHDFAAVLVRWKIGGTNEETGMTWYGGLLWRAELPPLPAGILSYRVCAVDAAGNEACSAELEAAIVPGGGTGGETSGGETSGTSGGATSGGETGSASAGSGSSGGGDASATDTAHEDDAGGCGCRGEGDRGSLVGLVVLMLGLRARRRRRSPARTSSPAHAAKR